MPNSSNNKPVTLVPVLTCKFVYLCKCMAKEFNTVLTAVVCTVASKLDLSLMNFPLGNIMSCNKKPPQNFGRRPYHLPENCRDQYMDTSSFHH